MDDKLCHLWLQSGTDQNKKDLASLLESRLLSRYFDPHLEKGSPVKFQEHPGFLLAASACMMLESLQRYRMAFLATSTKGHGSNIFKAFFSDTDLDLKYLKTETHTYKRAKTDWFLKLEVMAPIPSFFSATFGVGFSM